jgi:serine/threonine-protein kinase
MSRDSLFDAADLPPKTQFGVYRIEERIGAGGMGTVYRATDTKLERSVALKFVRPDLLNEVVMSRFEREARLLASLNHPHIAAIHGMEESRGAHFLVLEYVPGATLAEALKRGALPIHETLKVAKQIAEALEAAHVKGIIHRDLKPANIKLSPEGKVKVLDFGLAKSVRHSDGTPADGTTVTLSVDLTSKMTIVGTAAYMSPEQATGKDLDTRTDIWAFGCVLYEALSGKRAFRGETITELLAAVIEREPDWTVLSSSTPSRVQALVRRCLRKDPSQRLRDIGDARIELEECLAAPTEGERTRGPETITRRTVVSALSGAAVGAAAMGAFAIARYRGGVPRSLTRFSLAVPEGDMITSSFGRRVSISPDGTRVGYVVVHQSEANRFYLRPLGELKPRLVMDACAFPIFSPDGQWMVFQRTGRGRGVMKLNLGGGAPVPLCPEQNLMSGTWADDDTLYAVMVDTSGLATIPLRGGPPKEVLRVDSDKGERQPQSPHALPGANAVLLTMTNAETETFDDAKIVAFVPRTGEKRTLVEGGANPRYSRSGHLVFARDGKLLAVRFDPTALKVSGQPAVVVEGVHMSRNTGVVNYDVSATGDLAYAAGACDGGARTLIWVDRNGKATPVGLAPRSYLHPRLSPDGQRLAIEIEGPNHDLYLYDFDRSVLSKMTTDGASHWPVWSPDGRELAFRRGAMSRFKLNYAPVDRSAEPKTVSADGVSQSPDSWSPDGHALVYTNQDPGGVPSQIMIAPVEGGPVQRLDTASFPEGSPKFSPDGRWVAYCSAESGKPQVYVQAYPGPGAKIQVSSEGGTDPVWKRSGGEMFYRNGDSMMAVDVSTAPAFKPGRPRELWKGHYSHGMSSSCGPPGTTSSNYDVTADGGRFMMIRDDDQDRTVSKELVVVLGFANELTRLV